MRGDEWPDIVLFHGRLGTSPGECAVEAARRAAGLDVLECLWQTGRFGRTIVVTDDPSLAAALAGSGAIVEPSGPDFHFGRRLAALVAAHGLRRVLYVGAGSAALVEGSEWVALADLLETSEAVCSANNFLSADYIAFTPAAAVCRIEPPATDNDLPWRLTHAGGLPKVLRPRTLGSEVDIDTPSDLALLGLAADRLPGRLASLAGPAAAAMPAQARLLAALDDPEARLLVAGRVSAATWGHLERALARYTRLISEERGMRASGRLERGEVHSLLGMLIEQVGPRRFFEQLPSLCDAALIDSRVLFAHWQRSLSRADRFASDMLLADAVADPVVREFTAAAADCPVPVLLGGHSLVSGGLWLLAHHLQAHPRA